MTRSQCAINSGRGQKAGTILTDAELRHQVRENILAALKRTKWKISGEGGAAELLGVKPTTLASRMKKMRIDRPV